MPECKRCGQRYPRLTVHDRYCRDCEREVRYLLEADERRRTPRFAFGKSLDDRRAA